jgi:uncharacterized membrane protein YfhO
VFCPFPTRHLNFFFFSLFGSRFSCFVYPSIAVVVVVVVAIILKQSCRCHFDCMQSARERVDATMAIMMASVAIESLSQCRWCGRHSILLVLILSLSLSLFVCAVVASFSSIFQMSHAILAGFFLLLFLMCFHTTTLKKKAGEAYNSVSCWPARVCRLRRSASSIYIHIHTCTSATEKKTLQNLN